MRSWQKASQEGLSPAEWDDLLRPYEACVDAPSVRVRLVALGNEGLAS